MKTDTQIPYVRGPYKRKPRCIRGHVLEGDNLQINVGKLGRQQRCCITCRTERDKKRRSSPEERARQAQAMREWAKKNPEKVAYTERKRAVGRYGLTVERYDAMLAEQGGVCAICHEKCKSGRRLSVDHEHDTGRVRGLLCGNCNQGLGRFRDSPELFMAALKYLSRA